MIFSRRVEADFQKISKILLTFFISTKLTSRALRKHLGDPVLAKFCAPPAKFLRNRPKRLF